MNLEELAVMTPKKFAIKIEEIVKEGLGQTSYMDAILDYCEKNQMEPYAVAPLISKPLKEKIEAKKDKNEGGVRKIEQFFQISLCDVLAVD